jgi:hypothetical protein
MPSHKPSPTGALTAPEAAGKVDIASVWPGRNDLRQAAGPPVVMHKNEKGRPARRPSFIL